MCLCPCFVPPLKGPIDPIHPIDTLIVVPSSAKPQYQATIIHSLPFCESTHLLQNKARKYPHSFLHPISSLFDSPLVLISIYLSPSPQQDDLHSRPQRNICDTRLRPIKRPHNPPPQQTAQRPLGPSHLASPFPRTRPQLQQQRDGTAHSHACSPVDARFPDPRRFPRTYTFYLSRRSFSESIQPS